MSEKHEKTLKRLEQLKGDRNFKEVGFFNNWIKLPVGHSSYCCYCFPNLSEDDDDDDGNGGKGDDLFVEMKKMTRLLSFLSRYCLKRNSVQN